MYITQETCSKWWLEIWQWRVDVHDRKHDARVSPFWPTKETDHRSQDSMQFPEFFALCKKIFHLPTIREICVCNLVGGGMRFRLRDFESLGEETSPFT